MWRSRPIIRGFVFAAAVAGACLLSVLAGPAATRYKLRGYVTARPDDQTLKILDDVIHYGPETRLELHNGPSGKALAAQDLVVGTLLEAEGRWTAKHQFAAEKISCDASFLDKEIKESAYLQQEPTEPDKIPGGLSAQLKADGEILALDEKTQRAWPSGTSAASETPASAPSPSAGDPPASSNALPALRLAGRQVHYQGVRRADGAIAATRVELGSAAPPDAYKMPHGIQVERAKDPQTGIDVLEFRRGKKMDGRLKLFPVEAVQEYVSRLGRSLLPAGAEGTSRALEFRFFVIEDPEINAQAMPDGTVLVNTGLLGAAENEAQLAFILSHEIAHVLQVHYWREVRETRSKRVALVIAGLAAGYFIGDLGVFLTQLGLEAVVNGFQRRLENQADRLGLQNIVEHGYDAREAPRFSQIVIEHYGDRSTSKIWSNHDSSVLRGSFLTIQIQRQYPQGHFDSATADTPAFQAMREAMGPVKIM